jgi:thioesterase domain-containing protein
MSKARAWLADHSFRLQLVLSDWRKARSGQQTFGAFLRQREAVKRFLRAIGWHAAAPPQDTFEDRHSSSEHYDRWLDAYLDEAAARYAPRIYTEKVVLLCSSQEPRGWFLDPLLGWGPFVPAGIDRAVLDGDHFTVFQGSGLKQMAATVAAALELKSAANRPS